MSNKSEADERVKEFFELSRLYDIYGGLLSDHNRVIFEDYVLNNYSLAEIAEDAEISRQGVRDVVVRCSKKLYEFEDKLHLLKRIDETGKMLDGLQELLMSDGYESDKALRMLRKARDVMDL